jgi:hypothetical protein
MYQKATCPTALPPNILPRLYEQVIGGLPVELRDQVDKYEIQNLLVAFISDPVHLASRTSGVCVCVCVCVCLAPMMDRCTSNNSSH